MCPVKPIIRLAISQLLHTSLEDGSVFKHRENMPAFKETKTKKAKSPVAKGKALDLICVLVLVLCMQFYFSWINMKWFAAL